MKITYHGQSCLLIESNNKKVIIDPFISGNPKAVIKPEDIEVDAVILTHAHQDHFGDTIDIAGRNDCLVIAVAELATYCRMKGLKTHGMNIGGAYQFDGFRVKYTQAFHSSSIKEGDQIIYAGEPAGILLTMDETTLFHLGDTSLYSDLKLIGELHKIDVAAIPIGDNYTMGPDEALMAAEWVGAEQVIPIHYNTFPVIEQNGDAFVEKLKEINIQGHALKVGESANFIKSKIKA